MANIVQEKLAPKVTRNASLVRFVLVRFVEEIKCASQL